MKKVFICALLAQTCLSLSAAHAYDLPNNSGKLTGDLRARYEHVDSDAFVRSATAKTARLRLGYETPEYNGLQGFVEGETVQHIGSDRFNDTVRGPANFPSINDPEIYEINQAFVSYKPGVADSMLKVGRQGIKLDNQRFIGWSKFRQNDVTHDAALFSFDPIKDVTFTYAFSKGIHRVAGNRAVSGVYEGDINIIHGHAKLPHDMALSAYTYLLDFDKEVAEQNLSSRTHGARLSWEPDYGDDAWSPSLAAEYARQSDYGHSALSYDENYYQAEAGAKKGKTQLVLGFEQLGGNGTSAMQTPLTSGRSLDGWTDIFSTKPADGLRNYSLRGETGIPIDKKFGSLLGRLSLHDYHSVEGSEHYGYEYGAGLSYEPVKNNVVSLEAARYNADEFSVDTDKVWVTYEYKF